MDKICDFFGLKLWPIPTWQSEYDWVLINCSSQLKLEAVNDKTGLTNHQVLLRVPAHATPKVKPGRPKLGNSMKLLSPATLQFFAQNTCRRNWSLVRWLWDVMGQQWITCGLRIWSVGRPIPPPGGVFHLAELWWPVPSKERRSRISKTLFIYFYQ